MSEEKIKSSGKVKIRSVNGQPRRRAGRAWGPEFTVVSESDFSAEQWKALFADPVLEVRPESDLEKRIAGDPPKK